MGSAAADMQLEVHQQGGCKFLILRAEGVAFKYTADQQQLEVAGAWDEESQSVITSS